MGIVLTGGGARAAYQVGAVRAIYEILQKDQHLFDVVTGNSAGAINSVYLARHAHNWNLATEGLWNLWRNLRPQDIYELSTLSVTKIGSSWLGGVVLGGLTQKGSHANRLLDTTPLRKLIQKQIDFHDLNNNLQDGTLTGFSVATTNYYSGSSVVFYNSYQPIQDWMRTDRFSVQAKIELSHIMASSAIPLFFPPENIADSWYGDGCIRQSTPLSPAIHLGAQKIIAIGIRAPHSHERQKNLAFALKPNPTIGQIAGIMMNAVFLDALEADVERISRINNTIHYLDQQKKDDYLHNLRSIPVLILRPSKDLGQMTEQMIKQLPQILRYLMKGIGVNSQDGGDLLSYLAFDKSYTVPLSDLGYEDTMKRREEILRFVEI